MGDDGAAGRGAQELLRTAERIAAALERIAPPPHGPPDFNAAEAFLWRTDPDRFEPVIEINRIDLALLRGIDLVRDTFLENLERFAAGFPANNVLLWGARGMGKSSLVKAAHGRIARGVGEPLILIEIDRTDIGALHRLLAELEKAEDRRFLLFCDDLSFESPDSAYKSLKAVLEGGIRGRPGNVLFAATSNRRHLMPRDMIENERQTAISPSEATEEKVSLSDRFGPLGSGSTRAPRTINLDMVRGYADALRHVDFGQRIAKAGDCLAAGARCSFRARGLAVCHRSRRQHACTVRERVEHGGFLARLSAA